jgi:hypothetical protein
MTIKGDINTSMENKPKLTPAEIAAKLLDPEAYKEEQKHKAEVDAKKKKSEELKKKATAQPKTKVYFDVKVEAMIPAILTYKVLAEDAHQAAELIKGKSPNHVQHKLSGIKNLFLRVYNAGSCVLQYTKKF